MYDKIMESVEFIKSKVNRKPKIAVILGSGLGDLVNVVEDKEDISYESIPNFPVPTVKGHEGKLVFGRINDVEVLLMQGRFHYYEGYTMKEVTYPVYVMKRLGIEKIIVTNVCGGINTSFEPGTLMLIKDFINLFGDNPLIGVNDERLGTRFPDMLEPYKLELINKAKEIAKELNINGFGEEVVVPDQEPEVKPEVKPETKPGEGELVKTGDMTPILSLIGLSGASLGVATIMFRKRRAK